MKIFVFFFSLLLVLSSCSDVSINDVNNTVANPQQSTHEQRKITYLYDKNVSDEELVNGPFLTLTKVDNGEVIGYFTGQEWCEWKLDPDEIEKIGCANFLREFIVVSETMEWLESNGLLHDTIPIELAEQYF